MSRLLTILKYLIISGVLVLPLLFLRTTIDPVSVPRMAWLGILISLASIVIVLRSFRYSETVPWNPFRSGMIWSMIGYLIMQIVSMTQAINIQEGLFTFTKTLLGMISYLLIVIWLLKKSTNRLVLIKLFSLSGFVLAVIGLFQYFGIAFTDLPGNNIPYGTMANKNLLASSVFFTTFLTLYGCFRLKGAWRYFGIVSLCLELLLLILCDTRAVYLGLGGAIITALIAIGYYTYINQTKKLNFILRYRNVFRVGAILSILIVISLSFVVIHDFNQESDADRLLIKNDHNLKVRLGLWEKSLAMYVDNPGLGVGVGNWKIMIPKYGIVGRVGSSENKYFQRPHNDFIWVLTETGPLGFLFYLTIFVWGASYCIRLIRSSTDDLLFVILMLGFLTGYLGIAFFSYPMERISHTVLLMAMLALIVAKYHTQFPLKGVQIPVVWNRIGAGIIILIASCSLVLSSHKLGSEIEIKRAIAAAKVSAWEESISHIDQAKSPFVNLDPTATPFACYRGIANSYLGFTDRAFIDYQTARQVNPYHLQVLNNLATLYEQKGDHHQALEHYKMALQVSPALEQTLVNLAAVYYNLGDYKTAHEYLTQPRSGPSDPRYEYFLKKISEQLEIIE